MVSVATGIVRYHIVMWNSVHSDRISYNQSPCAIGLLCMRLDEEVVWKGTYSEVVINTSSGTRQIGDHFLLVGGLCA